MVMLIIYLLGFVIAMVWAEPYRKSELASMYSYSEYGSVDIAISVVLTSLVCLLWPLWLGFALGHSSAKWLRRKLGLDS